MFEFEIDDLVELKGDTAVLVVTGVIHDDETVFLTPIDGGAEVGYHFSSVHAQYREVPKAS